ncbi:MAG: sensor histidine kinase [Myxococcaceae bacterium]
MDARTPNRSAENNPRGAVISWILFSSAALSLCIAGLGALVGDTQARPSVAGLTLPVLLVVGGTVARVLQGTQLRALMVLIGLASLALCAWSAIHGSEDLLVILLLTPLGVTIILPEERRVGILLGLASMIAVAVATSWIDPSKRIVWIAQSLTMIGLAELASHRLRGLSKLIRAESDERFSELTRALAETSKNFLRLPDEASVYRLALEALRQQGMLAHVSKLEPEGLRVVAHSLEPQATPEVKTLLSELMKPRPLSSLPFLKPLFEREQTVFHPNVHLRIDESFSEIATIAKAICPRQGLDAPIVVRGMVYGMLSAQADDLFRTSTATLELFAGHIGAAVENAHQHQALAEQLNKVTALQKEVVAQARLSMLGEAAAVVSHEIRNPLGAIVNAVHLLRRGKPRAGSLTDLLSMIESEAMRLDKLVNDLLLLARPLEPRLKPVELGWLVERSIVLLDSYEQVRLRFSEPGKTELWAIGDEDQLQLAVGNLLSNALDASPAQGQIDVVLGLEGGRPTIAVEDRGSGIRETDLNRIFEPFFTTRATGTGLGLAIVKRVVQAHQGSIVVSNPAAGGARFAVSLQAVS